MKAIEVHLKVVNEIDIYTNNNSNTSKFINSINILKSKYDEINVQGKRFSDMKRISYAKYLKSKKELALISKNNKLEYDLKSEEVEKYLKNYIAMKKLCEAFKD